MLRLAVNDLLLAYFWHHGILPRSQNRTVYLLKEQSPILGGYDLYDAFIKIFEVDSTLDEMKEIYFLAKSEILSVYEKFWGRLGIVPFLEKTCNIQLEWGHESSMLYIFKWTMSLFHSNDIKNGWYDTKSFYDEYPMLHDFLGFSKINEDKINLMVEQYENVRKKLVD